jgi:hypothetical protein
MPKKHKQIKAADRERLMTEEEIERVFDALGLATRNVQINYPTEKKGVSVGPIYTTQLSSNSEPIVLAR